MAAYSYATYLGDGSNTVFTVPFSYLDKSHVHVKVSGVEVSYTWITGSAISVSPAPTGVVEVRRLTPKDVPPVSFSDGSVLKEKELDLLAIFGLYCSQETQDAAAEAITQSALGIALAIVYQGTQDVNPSVRSNGTPLEIGDLYFNKPGKTMRVWTGLLWQDIGITVPAVVKQPASPVVATIGQTSVPVPGGFDPNGILAFVNGVAVYPPNVNFSSGTNIVFSSALSAGDKITWVAFTTFQVPDAVTRVELAASSGSGLAGFLQSGAGAVQRTAQSKLRETVSVFDFMTPAQVADVSSGTGSLDVTAAINAAIASFPGQGTPTWKSWSLLFPNGVYRVTAPINIKNQQFGRIIGLAATIKGNFDGTVLQIGDTSGNNDVLWFHIEGLNVQQAATSVNARSVVMQHAYSCTVDRCYFYGGRFAFVLDGNANQISGTTFRGAITANVAASGGSNNEANTFLDCSNELAGGYGYDLSVSAGLGGFTRIIGGYCEANTSGSIRVMNSHKFKVDGLYFNLQNGAPGVVLDGTVGAAYPAGYGVVQDCRIIGPSGTAAKFIRELSSTSINCAYRRNDVEGGNCDLYGAAEKSINLDRKGKRTYIKNGVDFTDGNADGIPDGWTRGGTGAVATSTSNSPYGTGSAVQLSTTNGYIYQNVKFPANALLRISCYAATTGDDARIQLWSTGLGGTYKTASMASPVPGKLEFYLTPSERSSATAGELLLRNLGSGGTASFADLEIEDMTN